MSFASSRRSIGVRLTAWYFGVFVASTLLLFAAAGLSIRSSVRTSMKQTLRADLVTHRQVFEAEGLDGLKRLVATSGSPPRPFYLRVLDRKNGTLFEYRSAPEISFDDSDAQPQTDAPVVRPVRALTDGTTWNLGTVTLSTQLHLQLARSDETQEVLGHLRAGLVVFWLGAIALGLLGGFYLTRRALRPVGQLAAATKRVIESGDLALRVPVRGSHDELDELTQLFNTMLQRNETLVRGMREALDNVAHDLRTPLTRLRTGAEVALRDATDPGQMREALADGIEESERVLAMLTTLMDISEAETGVMKLKRVPVDLVELVRQVIDLYEDVAAERGIRLVTHLSVAAVVNGDRNRLHQVVANLVDNALKYTSSGGQVELSSFAADKWVGVAIKDTGLGIAAEDLPRIWQRLYRADPSRSERGLGLGLSFVKAIVAAHDGQVAVASEVGVGSTFTVELPKLL